MQKVDFKTSNGNMLCNLKINTEIPIETVRSLFKTLMLHLETSLIAYDDKDAYEYINKLRSEFFKNVLKYFVDINLQKGIEVPSDILIHLTKKKALHWGCDDD